MTSPDLEQYLALLKGQKSQLQAALDSKGQKPPAFLRRSRQDLESEFAQAAIQAEKFSRSGEMHSIGNCMIGAAYRPCTVALTELTPIALRDLTLETQHRGRVLIVRAISQPNRLISIQNAIEDKFGDVDRLAIYNLLPTALPNVVLPRGAVVAVKEPYYKRTADGGLMVRVDHPTDFVPLRPGSSMIPPNLAGRTIGREPSALGLKEQGNSAFSRRDFEAAIDSYSHALDVSVADDEDLRRDLCRNRAAANLRLGRYEPAITDALASLIPAEDTSETARAANIKALYRAGMAAYRMQEFYQAKQYFDQALGFNQDHKEARAERSRTDARISEQENGDYDFSAMAKSATIQNTWLDHASFVRRTKIAPAESRGRGLFATGMIKPGDIVLVEKAFHAAHINSEDISATINVNTDRVSLGSHSLRLHGVIDKMMWNPTLAKRYLDLFDGGQFGDGKECQVIDGRVAVDTFRVQSIAEFNGFGCPTVKSGGETQPSHKKIPDFEKSTGIWLHASYTNHSCTPNATRSFIGDMMIVRALREIPAGGEIFMTYANPGDPFAKRRKQLKEGYHFECDCDLCRAEAQVKRATADKRARLHEEILAFLSANSLEDGNLEAISMANKAKAEKLLRGIRETYPAALFERLPRLACGPIGIWVVRSVPRTAQDALEMFLVILRDMGYFVTIQESSAAIDRSAAYRMEVAVHAAMYAAQALVAIGNRGAASALAALGKEIYMGMYGVADGFESKFGISPRYL